MVFLAKQSARDSSSHVAIKFIPKQTILEFQNVARLQQVLQALHYLERMVVTDFLLPSFLPFSTGNKRTAGVRSSVHHSLLRRVRRKFPM